MPAIVAAEVRILDPKPQEDLQGILLDVIPEPTPEAALEVPEGLIQGLPDPIRAPQDLIPVPLDPIHVQPDPIRVLHGQIQEVLARHGLQDPAIQDLHPVEAQDIEAVAPEVEEDAVVDNH